MNTANILIAPKYHGQQFSGLIDSSLKTSLKCSKMKKKCHIIVVLGQKKTFLFFWRRLSLNFNNSKFSILRSLKKKVCLAVISGDLNGTSFFFPELSQPCCPRLLLFLMTPTMQIWHRKKTNGKSEERLLQFQPRFHFGHQPSQKVMESLKFQLHCLTMSCWTF